MLNCKETTRLLSESQERKLGVKERMELGVHTMMCGACRNFGHQMQALHDISKAYVAGANETLKASEAPDKKDL